MTPSSPFICWFQDCGRTTVDTTGGKCANLGELVRLGVEVPGGFAVTTEAHRLFVDRNGVHEVAAEHLRGVDLDDVDAVQAASRALRARIEGCPIPAEVRASVAAAYGELSRRCQAREALPVAVRSSATAEDLQSASFAGQLETYLWVEGLEPVLASLRRCWAALYIPHAIHYRAKMGIAGDHISMAVGVQQMVDARTGGVMFTLNPVNGDRSKILLEACWGLGEGLVSGQVDPDRFLVDKVVLTVLERAVARKPTEYRFDPERGKVEAMPVPDDRQRQPSLSNEELETLCRLAKQVEKHFGTPQDIEWALGRVARGGEAEARDVALYLLQSRPETVWRSRPRGPIAGPHEHALDLVLDNLKARASAPDSIAAGGGRSGDRPG
jgi:pyruvate, water dikinase